MMEGGALQLGPRQSFSSTQHMVQCAGDSVAEGPVHVRPGTQAEKGLERNVKFHVCLPAAFQPACLPAAFLPACLCSSLLACLPSSQLAFLPACLSASRSTCLPSCLHPSCLQCLPSLQQVSLTLTASTTRGKVPNVSSLNFTVSGGTPARCITSCIHDAGANGGGNGGRKARRGMERHQEPLGVQRKHSEQSEQFRAVQSRSGSAPRSKEHCTLSGVDSRMGMCRGCIVKERARQRARCSSASLRRLQAAL